MIRYRNKRTGQIVRFEKPSGRLDRLPHVWERLDDPPAQKKRSRRKPSKDDE
ncbi:MAG: hypothetical protein M5T61_21435 [Acidimicrobiia bacterium]|nr:hypothetical protein [Acidimicrobiia bacterium]